ncbi:MAG: ABC transporter permease [Armatimonadetes bacterium]|nr:ABC transporter permease [Armatimonadota bacterium]
MAFGMILAAISRLTAMHHHLFSEAVSGLFHFLSGILFPISILPAWLQFLAKWLPVTYWMEAIRRSIMPDNSYTVGLSGIGNTELVLILIGISGACLAVSILIFTIIDYFARKLGVVDLISTY